MQEAVHTRSVARAAVRLRPPPTPWSAELAGVLISERRLAQRVRQLAAELQADYGGGDLTIVALLSGTVVFLADLVRHLEMPLRLDFIGVASYGAGTEPGQLHFTKDLRLEVKDHDVLVVDDILDTGHTLARVLEKLRLLQPRSLRSCVLLNKPARRVENVRADYLGFEIPDHFVVGYGLDFAERYRNLPFVGVLKKELYA